ncbi:MAG TPA: efflux RND transporter periplasmic adaptor subunit [Gammaproteobacteria bacterium]|nr:efflux RND transporter periplasmic adaptor subunit [Gammaproteobacteria bacterium]
MARLTRNALRLISLIFLIGVTIALLIGSRPDTQAELQPPSPARVTIGEVSRMDIRPVTRVTGKLQPVRRANLRFEVSGNVVFRAVEPGQTVAEGDLLLRVDDGDFVDAVAESRARLSLEQDAVRRDRELLELIRQKIVIQQREVDRLERLGQESLASKSNYDATLRELIQLEEEEARLQHSVATANSRLRSIETVLSKAERNLERTKLRAPFAGTVNSVTLEIGDYVAAGQIALELVKLDQLDVSLETTGEIANQLQLGQTVEVTVDGKTRPGRLVAIAPDPNPATHTHAIRVRVSGDDFNAGQLADVVLPGKILVNVEVVPVSAVLQEEGNAFLFGIEDNHLVRQTVSLRARHNDWQVVEGVHPGMKIVTRDVAALTDGQEVFIE